MLSDEAHRFESLSFSEKRYRIRKKFDELIEMISAYDTNNVGMTWPGDVKRVQKLRSMKEAYDES